MSDSALRLEAQVARADALRKLHRADRPLLLPNAWDVASARAVVKAGFPVVATTSAGVVESLGWRDRDEAAPDEVPRRSLAGERGALAVLNLSPQATANEIRARYKELVKRLHPDANGGDRKAEDQLKTVIEAYRLLSGRQVA